MSQRSNALEDTVRRRVVADVGAQGLRPARPQEVAAVRAMAAELIGPGVASADVLARVHAVTGAALLLAGAAGRVDGLFAMILLNSDGEAAVRAGSFRAADPQPGHLAATLDAIVGLYAWAIAARTRASAQRLIDGARALGRGVAAHAPCYARPATPAGERLMRERLGFRDLAGGPAGLVWAPAFLARCEAAA